MARYTIVAIPCVDDYVWKLSSEEVPHMTILTVDDSLENESRVVDFIEHVIETTLCKFSLSVDHRGVLGPEEADVLFFETKYARQIQDFRANLLKDPEIFRAYSAVDQYPEWTPHLAMGYPATPAKPDDREYPGVTYVRFDKIAFWTEDYDGEEFQLDNDRYSNVEPALAYADDVNNVLAHFGIKGMHWGVRKNNPDISAKNLSTAASGLRRDPTKTANQVKVAQVGGLHRISDNDLKAMIQRMDDERKFKKHLQEDADRRKEGFKAAGKVLVGIGKVALPIVLAALAGKVAANANVPFRTSAFISRPAIEG